MLYLNHPGGIMLIVLSLFSAEKASRSGMRARRFGPEFLFIHVPLAVRCAEVSSAR